MISREQRARELEELARKREEYWDWRWERGRHRRAVALVLLVALWLGFLVAYWFMLEPSRRWTVIAFGALSAVTTSFSWWRTRRKDAASSRDVQ